jgi:hypothetical protein
MTICYVKFVQKQSEVHELCPNSLLLANVEQQDDLGRMFQEAAMDYFRAVAERGADKRHGEEKTLRW